jgi:hypothetical protein
MRLLLLCLVLAGCSGIRNFGNAADASFQRGVQNARANPSPPPQANYAPPEGIKRYVTCSSQAIGDFVYTDCR